MRILSYIVLFFIILVNSVFSQTEVKNELIIQDTNARKKTDINPLAPAKAAFYSAILPGLGQAHNKKYWKIPIVYCAIGSGIYFYSLNNKNYHQYRDAYKKRLANEPSKDLEFLDKNRLIAGQKFYQKNRDLSLLVTVGLYILNIVDANVDAHLIQFNINDNLSLKPDLQKGDLTSKQNLALTFTYNF